MSVTMLGLKSVLVSDQLPSTGTNTHCSQKCKIHTFSSCVLYVCKHSQFLAAAGSQAPVFCASEPYSQFPHQYCFYCNSPDKLCAETRTRGRECTERRKEEVKRLKGTDLIQEEDRYSCRTQHTERNK